MKKSKQLFNIPKGSCYKNIDGSLTCKTPIGYCKYHGHPGYLTTSEYRTHKCEHKHCRLLVLNPNHPEFKKLRKANRPINGQFMATINDQLLKGEITGYKYDKLCRFSHEQQVSYLANVQNHKQQVEYNNHCRECEKKRRNQARPLLQKIMDYIKSIFGGKNNDILN